MTLMHTLLAMDVIAVSLLAWEMFWLIMESKG